MSKGFPNLVFSTKGSLSLYDIIFQPKDVLIFGRETGGLGEKILNQYKDQTLVIPMPGQTRSLNLSNAVSIALYEALRQTGALSTDHSAT